MIGRAARRVGRRWRHRPGVRRVARLLGLLNPEGPPEAVEPTLAGPEILSAFANAYPEAFFVEIGANDGDQHDHLRPVLDRFSWSGIMVEPVPYVFERLRSNFHGRSAVTLANVAIADRNGHLPFYHLREVADREAEGLPRWYDGIGSFSRDAVLGHAALLPGLQERVACIDIECVTFQTLCERYQVQDVDVLVIDTEGYDGEIIRSIEWTRYRPTLVIYEHYHLDDGERAALETLFTNHGYELKSEGFDTWGLIREAAPSVMAVFRDVVPGIPAVSAQHDRRTDSGHMA